MCYPHSMMMGTWAKTEAMEEYIPTLAVEIVQVLESNHTGEHSL